MTRGTENMSPSRNVVEFVHVRGWIYLCVPQCVFFLLDETSQRTKLGRVPIVWRYAFYVGSQTYYLSMKDQSVVHSYSVVISILHVLWCTLLECHVWLVLIHRARKIKSVQVCGNAPFKVGPTLHRNRMHQRRLSAGYSLEISIKTQTCIRIAKNKPPASRFKLPPSSEVHMVFSFQGYRSRITIGSLQPRTASSSPLTSCVSCPSPWVWTSTGHGMWYDMVTDHVWRPMFSHTKTNKDQPSMAVLAPDFGWFCTFYSHAINVLVHSSIKEKELLPEEQMNTLLSHYITMNQPGLTVPQFFF